MGLIGKLFGSGSSHPKSTLGIMLEVPSQDIAPPCLSRIGDTLNSAARLTRERGDFCFIDIFISGYDTDTRYLDQIPEVAEWYRQLNRRYPEALYFLAPQSLLIDLLCAFPNSAARHSNDKIRINKGDAHMDAFLPTSVLGFQTRLQEQGVDMNSIFGLVQRLPFATLEEVIAGRYKAGKDYVLHS